MRASSLILALLAILPSAAFGASLNMDPQLREQATQYCTQDAMRFCTAYLLDEAQMADCMKANHTQLSPTCRAIVERNMRKGKS